MTNKEYLESIIEEAQELLKYASAGGDPEIAFNLAVSTDDLHNAFNALYNNNKCVRDELGPIA